MGRVVEINLQRLLTHCETLASDAQHKETKVDWRLSKVNIQNDACVFYVGVNLPNLLTQC